MVWVPCYTNCDENRAICTICHSLRIAPFVQPEWPECSRAHDLCLLIVVWSRYLATRIVMRIEPFVQPECSRNDRLRLLILALEDHPIPMYTSHMTFKQTRYYIIILYYYL